jgi:hypothetical protein
MEGCVNGAGRVGIDTGAEGGARLIAPPCASGTDAGGTGGGWSVNIWAETEAGIAATSAATSAKAASKKPPRLDLWMSPPRVIMHAFH